MSLIYILFFLATLALLGFHVTVLVLIIRRLIHKYVGNEKDGAGRLEVGTMDLLPMLLSAVFIIAILVTYLAIASLTSLWGTVAMVVVLAALTFWLGRQMLAILKKIK